MKTECWVCDRCGKIVLEEPKRWLEDRLSGKVLHECNHFVDWLQTHICTEYAKTKSLSLDDI